MHTLIGKILIVIGIILVIAGLLVFFKVRIPWLGRLPGDIRIEKDGFRLYIPITTCIIISIIVTLILVLLKKR